MRSHCWPAALLLLMFVSGLHAANVPYAATVVAPEVEVQSCPGNAAQPYPTNRLRRGDRVEVVKVLDHGWLAITPPEGSYSWINGRFVEQFVSGEAMWTVVVHDDAPVPVLYGSSVRTDVKPYIEGTRVRRGTQLRALGKLRTDADGKWLPVVPPPGELRYVRAEAVAPIPGTDSRTTNTALPVPAQTTHYVPSAPAPLSPAVTGAAPAPGYTPSPPPAPEPPLAPGNPDPRWLEAQQAERTGDYTRAIQLYSQLGQAATGTNHELAMQAFNRAQRLRDLQRNDVAAAPSASPTPSRSVTAPAQAPAGPGLSASGPGRLVRAGRSLDYQPTYMLLNSQGLPTCYVTPVSGLDLEHYVDRPVELFGSRVYRQELRAYQFQVQRIQLVR
jgi:hypothetical protein